MNPPLLRALIVDDERLARRALGRLLQPHPDVEVVGDAASIDEATALLAQHRPDLVFLDVQLRGETGFDLFARTDASFRTIFVTAYDAYAVRAFEVNALDYLLKPIDPARLAEALARARPGAPPDAPASPEATERDSTEPDRPSEAPSYRYDDLFFHDDGRRAGFFRIADVVYIEAAANYTAVVLRSGQKHLVLQGVGGWEAVLPADHFVRIHRSYLINVSSIERIERTAGYAYHVFLEGHQTPLPMSRRRARALKDRLKAFPLR